MGRGFHQIAQDIVPLDPFPPLCVTLDDVARFQYASLLKSPPKWLPNDIAGDSIGQPSRIVYRLRRSQKLIEWNVDFLFLQLRLY